MIQAAFISAAAIILSAVAAGFWARSQIRANRLIARRNNTLNAILRFEEQPFYQQATRTFIELKKSDALKSALTPTTSADMKNREGLLAFLNHFELIAIGIEKDTLDEELYKDWMGTSVVRYWYQAQPYIARSRLKNKRAFERFCQLAKKWEKDPKIATSMADLSDLQKIEADETASARSAGHL